MEESGGLVVRGRVEIDMRRPFKSVKEAVMLFGEKVLADEVYTGQKLKQTAISEGEKKQEYRRKVGAVTAELEETKQSLEKAKEEDTCMAYYLASLKQELEETKSELKQLKLKGLADHHHQYNNYNNEITEEVKFIQHPPMIQVDVINNHPDDDDDDDEHVVASVFDKKRSVKFASPPSLTKLMVEADPKLVQEKTTPFSLKKKASRKTINIPSFGGIFARKIKGTAQSASTTTTTTFK